MPPVSASPEEAGDALHPGSLLSPTVRRDVADLNRQFLELGLSRELADDPRFAWSDPVREAFRDTDEPTRTRMAASPFTFFELRLPPAVPRSAAEPGRVEDAGLALAAGAGASAGRCASFLHSALFLAWQLADVAPLATRIVLGLRPAVELQLNEMSLWQLLQLAACPDLIRPRWASNLHFWTTLASASRSNSLIAMQSAQCIGICMLDSLAAASAGPPRGHGGSGRRARR